MIFIILHFFVTLLFKANAILLNKMVTHLVYIHIGKVLPEYLYDSLYQTLLVSPNTKSFVLLDNSLIHSFRKVIESFNISSTLVECIPLSILQNSSQLTSYSKYATHVAAFRDGFWVSTTTRFFYIHEFMKLFSLENVFHIENDVMIYEDLTDIQSSLDDKIYMVQDSSLRVIPSILFLPNQEKLAKLNDFILKRIQSSNEFLNDMQLLGSFPDKACFPFNFETDSKYIFDGAAMGQFLGGVDPNNLPKEKTETLENLKIIRNPSKGFINETCDFKISSDIEIFKKSVIVKNQRDPIKIFFIKKEENTVVHLKQIVNLHIHSKQLYQFSSLFNISYDDILTGDRVLSLADFVISTPDIYRYHKNMQNFVDVNKVILIKDFNNVNVKAINSYFEENSTTTIKLFIYTHILDDFIQKVYHQLSKKFKYTIYLHNSDHSFGSSDLHKQFVRDKNIKKIFAQNVILSENTEKVTLLPIGLANSMFNHGDTLSLYQVMARSYKLTKLKSIYININPTTYVYRAEILKGFKDAGVPFNTSKPFKEYLNELSQHHFCLCIRGNGLDTHRFHESLYLGVIPVIINNKHTNMDGHVQYLKKLGLPFFEIKEDNLDEIIQKYFKTDFFDETLYKRLTKYILNTQSMDQLKLSYYK